MIKRTKKVVNYTMEEYDGIKYRSSSEAWFARQLTENGIEFKYEAKSFIIFPGTVYNGKTYPAITYTPDFFLKDGTLIEYKGYPNEAWPLKEKMIVSYMKKHNLKWIRINNKTESLSFIAGTLGINEEYRPVRNFEGYYEVSSIGNVIKARRTERSKKIPVRVTDKDGEHIAILRDSGNRIVRIPVMMIVFNTFNVNVKDPYHANSFYYYCRHIGNAWKSNEDLCYDSLPDSPVRIMPDIYWSKPVNFDCKVKKGYAYTPMKMHELSGMSMKKCKKLFSKENNKQDE